MQNELKLNQVLTYGLPGLPLAMLGLPLFVYLPTYYSENLGISLTAVGIALLLARSLDVITDPLIGLLNDRYPKLRSVLWRRKSYIILGIPILLLGLNFLLRPEAGVTAFYLFIWSFVTYLGWTLINIPWLALGAEISHNYHEKSALASSREIFAVVGTVLVISLPVALSIQSDLNTTLDILATLLTFLLPLALLPLLWNLKSLSSVDTNSEASPQIGFKNTLFTKELFNILKYPAIKRLLPAYFVNSFANALPATLFILFVNYVLETPEQLGILLITYFLSAIAGIPLWLYLARKTDKHISWCIALVGAIASFIWVPFLDVGDFYPFLMICVASGFCLGADVVMPASIQADISQQLANGNQLAHSITADASTNQPDSTALLFGIWGLLTKFSLAFAVGIAFPLLEFVGLKTEAMTSQISNQNATMTLMVLYALIPVILKIWVVFQMWQFPFGKSFFKNLSSSESVNNTIYNRGKQNEDIKAATNDRSFSIISTNKRVQ